MSGASIVPTIGILTPALAHGGGVPAVADFLCRQIERTGRFRIKLFSLATSSRDECSVRMLAPRTWRGYPRSANGIWNGRKFTHFGAVAAEFEFQRLRPTRLLQRELAQCDLIQVVSGSAAPALAAVGCDRPVVLQVATRAVVERRKALARGNLGLRAWRRLMLGVVDLYDDRALCSVDAVMVENQWMLDYASRTVSGRTTVVNAPPGIDCEEFHPAPSRRELIGANPYVLFVGRLSDPRKNVGLLARSYALLCASRANPPDLVFAGGGDLPPSVLLELSKLPQPGHVKVVRSPSFEALLTLFQGAACVALPSDEEGLGLVVIEAMACGVPVVSTRCGGPETIISHGKDGFLVALDDPQEFARHLQTLCCDIEANLTMGNAARQTALARFSAGAAFRPFLQTYDRLLGRSSTAPSA